MRRLVEGDDLTAAQDERDGEGERAEAEKADEHHRGSAHDEPGRSAPTMRDRLDAVSQPGHEPRARLAPFGDRGADQQRDREHERGEEDRLPPVHLGQRCPGADADERGQRGEDGDPVITPVTQASACDARTPERAAKIAVNAGEREGASERTKDAAPGSIPATAR